LPPSRRTRPVPAQPSRSTTFRPSLDPADALALAHCLAKSPRRRTEPSRLPPPAIAVRPLRPLLRPNSGHPQALGEHVVTPHSLPSRERRRPRRILASRAAPTAKGGIAKGRIFLGCLAQTEGIVVMFSSLQGP
jgi:hypothetical protein